MDRYTSARLEIVTDHCYRLHIYSTYQLLLRLYKSFRKVFCASYKEMRDELKYLQWSRNNQENATLSAVYIGHTRQAKLFISDFRQLLVLKVFNHSISPPILILHLLHFEFITTFSLILAESVKICVPRGRPAPVLFPDMFFFVRLRRFWGQRKGHMNITERYESFVRDVKNYFTDSFSNFSPFPLYFYVKKI